MGLGGDYKGKIWWDNSLKRKERAAAMITHTHLFIQDCSST
jgi:hypothetical protein